MKKLTLFLLASGLLLSAGCTPTQQFAGGGALAGGAAGAIIGNQSGNRDKGLLIGTVVGALAGAALGQRKELNEGESNAEQQIAICPSCNSRVDVTGFPAHSTVACPNCKSQFTF
jgi:outer membrane lipoprotein SlyB